MGCKFAPSSLTQITNNAMNLMSLRVVVFPEYAQSRISESPVDSSISTKNPHLFFTHRCHHYIPTTVMERFLSLSSQHLLFGKFLMMAILIGRVISQCSFAYLIMVVLSIFHIYFFIGYLMSSFHFMDQSCNRVCKKLNEAMNHAMQDDLRWTSFVKSSGKICFTGERKWQTTPEFSRHGRCEKTRRYDTEDEMPRFNWCQYTGSEQRTVPNTSRKNEVVNPSRNDVQSCLCLLVKVNFDHCDEQYCEEPGMLLNSRLQ